MNNQGKIKNLLIQGKNIDEIFAQVKRESNLIRQDQFDAARNLIKNTKKEYDKELRNEQNDDSTIIRNLEAKVKELENENDQLKIDTKFLIEFYPLMEIIISMNPVDAASIINKDTLETMNKKINEIKLRIKPV
jgi:predicted RNase H-like nuclease (RuvC/YqgF family)